MKDHQVTLVTMDGTILKKKVAYDKLKPYLTLPDLGTSGLCDMLNLDFLDSFCHIALHGDRGGSLNHTHKFRL